MPPSSHPLGFLLLHGGGMDTWVWEKLVPHLALPAHAVPRLPHDATPDDVTVADCARHIWDEADRAGFTRVIMVAHSIAGILAPEAAAMQPKRTAHMALVAANVPEEGKTSLSVFGPVTRWQMELGVRLTMWGMTPVKPMQMWMEEHLCNDLSPVDTARVMKDGLNIEPPAFFFEKISRTALPPVPRSYIKLAQDLVLPPDVQDDMAANIAAETVTLNAGHMAMMSKPKELADILNKIAGAA